MNLFDELKQTLANQLDHIILNFVYYLEELAVVNMGALLKCFEFIHRTQTATILTAHFKVCARRRQSQRRVTPLAVFVQIIHNINRRQRLIHTT
jgi:hypothetical protein